MTHFGTPSTNLSDSPRDQGDDQDSDEEGEIPSSAPKPKPRLSRQSALLAGHEPDEKRKLQSRDQKKNVTVSSSTTTESGPNSTDNEASVETERRFREDDHKKDGEADIKQEANEGGIKSRMKSFLTSSSFGKKKKANFQQSVEMPEIGSKSTEIEEGSDNSSVIDM